MTLIGSNRPAACDKKGREPCKGEHPEWVSRDLGPLGQQVSPWRDSGIALHRHPVEDT